jgi:predicted transcriptional regulator
MQTAKQAARQVLEQVPEQASWDDIMYELYVKQKLESGLKAVADGRTLSHEEAKRRLLNDAG